MTKDGKSGKIAYNVFFTFSLLSFIAALISLWQGIVRIKQFDGEFEDFQQMVHSFFTFQNEGLILVGAAFFLFIVAIQLSIYALLLKK